MSIYSYTPFLSLGYCILRTIVREECYASLRTDWKIILYFIRLLILHACGDKPQKIWIILYSIQRELETAINIILSNTIII